MKERHFKIGGVAGFGWNWGAVISVHFILPSSYNGVLMLNSFLLTWNFNWKFVPFTSGLAAYSIIQLPKGLWPCTEMTASDFFEEKDSEHACVGEGTGVSSSKFSSGMERNFCTQESEKKSWVNVLLVHTLGRIFPESSQLNLSTFHLPRAWELLFLANFLCWFSLFPLWSTHCPLFKTIFLGSTVAIASNCMGNCEDNERSEEFQPIINGQNARTPRRYQGESGWTRTRGTARSSELNLTIPNN